MNLHLPHYNFTVEFLQCILTHFHRQRTEITPHSSLRDKNTWLLQHYSDSDHHNWHFFFFLTISDQIIGRCGDFKNAPMSTISNGDRRPSSRLSDSRSVIQFVSQKDMQTSDRPISESDHH